MVGSASPFVEQEPNAVNHDVPRLACRYVERGEVVQVAAVDLGQARAGEVPHARHGHRPAVAAEQDHEKDGAAVEGRVVDRVRHRRPLHRPLQSRKRHRPCVQHPLYLYVDTHELLLVDGSRLKPRVAAAALLPSRAARRWGDLSLGSCNRRSSAGRTDAWSSPRALAAEQQVKDLVARKALGCSSGQGDEVVVRPDKCEHEALEFDRQCSQQQEVHHPQQSDAVLS